VLIVILPMYSIFFYYSSDTKRVGIFVQNMKKRYVLKSVNQMTIPQSEIC